MPTTKHIIYDSEQGYHDKPYVWCFTLFSFNISISDPNWKTIATSTKPVYKETVTVFIKEVADFLGKTMVKPLHGKYIKVDTWNEAVNIFQTHIGTSNADTFFSHNLDGDMQFFQNTHKRFSPNNRKVNVATKNIDKLLNINAWKNIAKVCTTYTFDIGVSPKFVKRLKLGGCEFIQSNTKSMQNLMRYYYNDTNHIQQHDCFMDCYELYKLLQLRFVSDGVEWPSNMFFKHHSDTTLRAF